MVQDFFSINRITRFYLRAFIFKHWGAILADCDVDSGPSRACQPPGSHFSIRRICYISIPGWPLGNEGRNHYNLTMKSFSSLLAGPARYSFYKYLNSPSISTHHPHLPHSFGTCHDAGQLTGKRWHRCWPPKNEVSGKLHTPWLVWAVFFFGKQLQTAWVFLK